MAQAYIQAMADFNKSKWESVIKNLQFIFDQDIDYAGGTSRQALYDAYIARGDAYTLNGRVQSALTDYQAAVTIAQLRPDSLLRLFEAQARVGNALGLMGNYQSAVYQYRAALEEAGILASVAISPELDRVLKNAENAALRGRYSNAYNLYKGAMTQVITSLQTVTHTMTGDDYLASLAKEYQTTVSAILAANKLTDPNSIAVGDKIIIPVLPTP
jgi:tetratricopeptide (TPR) repeat protein